MHRHFMKCRISADAYDINIIFGVRMHNTIQCMANLLSSNRQAKIFREFSSVVLYHFRVGINTSAIDSLCINIVSVAKRMYTPCIKNGFSALLYRAVTVGTTTG